MHQLTSAFGLFVLLGICWPASNNRRATSCRLVACGTALQVVFAVFILKTRPGYVLFDWLTRAFEKFCSFTDAGGQLVWGWLYLKDTPPVFLIDILMVII